MVVNKTARRNVTLRGSSNTRHTHRKPPKRTWRRRHPFLFWGLIVLFAPILLGLTVFIVMYVTTDIPQPDKIAMAEKTNVYYADGKTLIGSYAEQNREIISCNALPKHISNAIVASENRTFYKDTGIDLKGIGRALLKNITTGSRQGGSTITQQYAERYYLGETKSYLGKLREAILAIKIAQQQDKQTVLCNYMNTIYFGRGAYGIQAAAKAYFGIDAKDLSLSQSALLAGIIPAPSSWDPAVGPKEASIRFKRVIRIMKEDHYINAKEASQARMPETKQHSAQNTYAGPSGYIMSMVRDELTQNGAFTKEDLDTGGYRIVTTIEKDKQDAMFNVASPSQPGKGRLPDGLQIGSVSVNAKNGAIIAMYAGDDYLKKPLNNVTQALYLPGSTMKPFALMGAIQAGMSLNTLFNGNTGQKFEGIEKPVNNFGNMNYGMVDMYQATAQSVNTAYMALQEKLGRRVVAQTAVAAGLSPKRITGDNPFTVLGNDSVHVSEIARAFSTFANKGIRPDLHIVASVKNPDNKEFYRAPTTGKQIFPASSAALASKAMLSTVQYGTATEARALGRPVAGKSGTANDETAVSFVGYTPSVVTVFAVWYPGAKGEPQALPAVSNINSSYFPTHLFTQYMRKALQGTPVERFPEAKDTGKLGGPDGTWGLGSAKHAIVQDKDKDKDDKKDSEEKEKSTEDENDMKRDEHTGRAHEDDSSNDFNSTKEPGVTDPYSNTDY